MRTLGEEQLLVVLNFAEEESQFALPDRIEYPDSELLLSNYGNL